MRVLLLSMILMLLPGISHSQDKKAQDAQRRLQAANQRLAAEKAQLERDKAQLAQKLAEAEKSGAAAARQFKSERGVAVSRKEQIEKLEQAVRELEQRIGAGQEREELLALELGETEELLGAALHEGEQLRKRLANQVETIAFWQGETEGCRTKNGELGKLGLDLAERYRAKTCDDVQAENEPFTGIGRARMENLLEDYRDKVRAQRYEVKR